MPSEFSSEEPRVSRQTRSTKPYERGSETPELLAQYDVPKFGNPPNPTALNEPKDSHWSGSLERNVDLERKLTSGWSSINDDMTYGAVPKNESSSHGSMTPFFSSRGGAAELDEERSFENYNRRKLELFTGDVGSPYRITKEASKPLFKPVMGMANIHGTQSKTDVLRSWYIPSMEKRKELPVQPIKVAPGLNLGYNESDGHGYHSTYRPMPKTIDELRSLSNPKITYTEPVIPGSRGRKRQAIPSIVKRKPDRFTENKPGDMRRSLGYFRAPPIQCKPNLLATNRSRRTKPYVGPASGRGACKTSGMLPKTRESHKTPHKGAGPRGSGGLNTSGYARNSNEKIRPTGKDMCIKSGYQGQMQGQHKGPMPHNFRPNVTLQDTLENGNRVGPPVMGRDEYPGPNYAHAPGVTLMDIATRNPPHSGGVALNGKPTPFGRDAQGSTTRDTTASANHIGGAKTTTGYPAINYAEVARKTHRQTLENNGHIGGPMTQHGNLQFGYNPLAPIVRDLTVHSERAGNMDKYGTRHCGAVFDPLSANIRDLTSNQERVGNVGGHGTKHSGTNFNPLDSNIKDLTIRSERAGNVGGYGTRHTGSGHTPLVANTKGLTIYSGGVGNVDGCETKHQGISYDPLGTSIRDLAIHPERVGNVGGNGTKQPGVNLGSPATTMGDLSTGFERAGNVGGYGTRQPGMSRDPPATTMGDLSTSFERAGNVGGYGTRQPGTSYDPPVATMGDLSTGFERAGNVGGYGTRQPGVNYDPPVTTMGDLSTGLERAGNVGGYGTRQPGVNYDPPVTTMGDLSTRLERSGNVGGYGTRQPGVNYDSPGATMGDLAAYSGRAGNVGGYGTRQPGTSCDAPGATMGDLAVHAKRAGIVGGYGTKQPVTNYDPLSATMGDLAAHSGRAGNVGGRGTGQPGVNHDPLDTTMGDLAIYSAGTWSVGGETRQPGINHDSPGTTMGDLAVHSGRAGNVKGHGGRQVSGHDPLGPTTKDLMVPFGDPYVGATLPCASNRQNLQRPSATARDLMIDSVRAGNAGAIGHDKQPGFAYDVAKPTPTVKQLTIVDNRAGGPSAHRKQLRQVGRPQDTTLRDMVSLSDRGCNIGPSNALSKSGYDVAQQGVVVRPTMRTKTQHNNYINPVVSVGERGGHEVAHALADAKPTKRLLTQHKRYVQPAQSSYTHQGSRAATRASTTNTERKRVLGGRQPTTCGADKGPTLKFTQTRLRTPTELDRGPYRTESRPQDRLRPTASMRSRSPSRVDSDRLDLSSLEMDALSESSYISDTQRSYAAD